MLWQAGSQMKYWLISKFLKFFTDHIIRIFTAFNKGMYSVIIVLLMHFSWLFWVTYVYGEACYGGM